MNPFQLMGQFTQLMNNPTAFLTNRGMNIPPEMMNDPNRIIQHLVESGQLSRNQLEQAQRIANTFLRR